MSSISARRSSSRFARYSGDSLVKFVCRNVPSTVVCTIVMNSTIGACGRGRRCAGHFPSGSDETQLGASTRAVEGCRVFFKSLVNMLASRDAGATRGGVFVDVDGIRDGGAVATELHDG